ncbi:MAG: beta-ketoacyl-[acyl-carrier-protein] synthase family protein [bacterium]|nr:beta-ketoacyl-[acyl-carrier-protein] synthase family protein [bacterium]
MSTTERRSVAITGIGMVTPLGLDVPSTWQSLMEGDSGIGPITGFDASGFPTRIAAEVKGFDPQSAVDDRKSLKYTLPFTRFALAAAEEAIQDAGIRPTHATSERWALSCGSGMMTTEFDFLQRFQQEVATDGEPDLARLGAEAEHFISAPEFARQRVVSGQALLHQRYGIRGYSANLHTACSSGGQALGLAMRLIRAGDADFVLAGGYDSMITPVGLTGFCLLGAVSPDNDFPDRASRPFDRTRNGFVLGEGAGFFVLEEWQAARERGANIYAELAGEGNSLSSYRITDSHPSGDGPIQALRAAVADAGENLDTVDYINAHGTSTQMNDLCETNAVKAVFGERAPSVPVSSTKGQMGHLIAAAGAVEGAICALAIHHGTAPMTANLVDPDPQCDLDYISEGCRPLEIDVAISNSFGFGGSNSSLAFRSSRRCEQ